MKKLTFGEVSSQFENLTKQEMLEFIAGDGIILRGNGSSGSPYEISSGVAIGFASDATRNAILGAIGQYNSAGGANGLLVNGKYYKFKISTYSGAADSNNYTLGNGTVRTIKDVGIGEVSGTPYNGDNPIYGVADANDQAALYTQNHAGYQNMSQSTVTQKAAAHELGHTYGLSDNQGSVMNTFSSSSSGYISSSPGSVDATAVSHMLQNGGIHWGQGVPTP